LPNKEKNLGQPDNDPPTPLFLPTIKGMNYTKADVELLRELGVEIRAYPDGTYTINGETPETIREKFKKTMEELHKWAYPDGEIRIPGVHVERYCELRRQGMKIEEIERALGVRLRVPSDKGSQ
jgi:hypothetical protein